MEEELLEEIKTGYMHLTPENDNEQFWNLWKIHKPQIIIQKIFYPCTIPKDAIVNISDMSVNRQFLYNISHVEKIIVWVGKDYLLRGYTGHAKFEEIRFQYSKICRPVPKADRYNIACESTKFTIVFDCEGKELFIDIGVPRDGFFKKVIKYFINFSELSVRYECFRQCYNEVPEVFQIPDIRIGIISDYWTIFDTKILDGIYIENLRLYDEPKQLIISENVDLQIVNIVGCDMFEEFISSIMRCNTKSART